MRDSRGISGARLGDGELKIKVSVVEAATTRVQVTQLLFKWDTVTRRGGLLVLSLKGPPEFQSLPYSVSRMMRSQKNLKDWGLRGPSSASSSSSLR